MYFLEKYKKAIPKNDEIALIWLGQAGFIIKTSAGKIILIDAYLSDILYREDGVKRIMMNIIEPEDVNADVILASHSHKDHLDLDSLPTLMKNGAQLICCRKSYEICKNIGIDMIRVEAVSAGDTKNVEGFHIEAVFCDHGDYAPEAVGFIIEMQGIKVYFVGDSSYQIERMDYLKDKEIDLLLLPINGEYGNMNERDAAMLAEQIKPKIAIPCHFGTFAKHKGDSFDFEMIMKMVAPDCTAYTMTQGEILYYSRTGMIHN